MVDGREEVVQDVDVEARVQRQRQELRNLGVVRVRSRGDHVQDIVPDLRSPLRPQLDLPMRAGYCLAK